MGGKFVRMKRWSCPMDYCDLECKFASFPKSEAVDGSRSCRTFIALYCSKKKSLVHKNLPCDEKRDGVKKKDRVRK
jgi:hypothetical protein